MQDKIEAGASVRRRARTASQPQAAPASTTSPDSRCLGLPAQPPGAAIGQIPSTAPFS